MSEARIVSEWLAAGLAAEAAENAAVAARLAAVPDPFDDDFEAADPHERLINGLARGLSDESLAAELEVDLTDLAEFKRHALEREAAGLLSVEHVHALIEAGVNEVTRRAYIGLGESMPGERSDLLNVLIGVYRLRLEALAQREGWRA